jgi:hypothetical protein
LQIDGLNEDLIIEKNKILDKENQINKLKDE